MKLPIRRNENLMTRLGDVMSLRTGIPRQEIVVREPLSNTRGSTPIAKQGQVCGLCNRVFEDGASVKRVIVQNQYKPASSLQKLILCARMNACVERFTGQQEE